MYDHSPGLDSLDMDADGRSALPLEVRYAPPVPDGIEEQGE
jgi:hypothetical protein